MQITRAMLGWSKGATIALAVVLAFFFGYLLTLRPLLARMSFASAARAMRSSMRIIERAHRITVEMFHEG